MLCKSPTRTAAFLAANRRNALKSTGPRTARGKARSCLNNLKHGRCAKRLPEKTGGGGRPGRGSALSKSARRDWGRLPGADRLATGRAAVGPDDGGHLVPGAARRDKWPEAAISIVLHQDGTVGGFCIPDSIGSSNHLPPAQDWNCLLGATKKVLDAATTGGSGAESVPGRGSNPWRGPGKQAATSGVPAGTAGVLGKGALRPRLED